MATKINICVMLLLATCMMADCWDLSRRMFERMGCKGVHDKPKMARLVRLCVECYEMYQSSRLHLKCRANCFKNKTFGYCLKDLMYDDEESNLQDMVDHLRGEEK